MTRKLNTLFVAAVVAGMTTATGAFAAVGTFAPQPSRAQGLMDDHGGTMNKMGRMSPDQTKRMIAMMDKCNHMAEGMSNVPKGQATHPGGTGSR